MQQSSNNSPYIHKNDPTFLFDGPHPGNSTLTKAATLQFSTMPFTVETDSSEVLALVDPAKPNLSKYCNTVDAICSLLQEREGVKMVKCSRSQNNVSYTLANFARTNASSEIWLDEKPQFAIDALRQDSVHIFD